MLGAHVMGQQPLGGISQPPGTCEMTAGELDRYLHENTDRAGFVKIMQIFRNMANGAKVDFQTIDVCMRWLYRGRTFIAPE